MRATLGPNAELVKNPNVARAGRGEGAVKFRVELVWEGEREGAAGRAPSIYLTADGRVILQGAAVSRAEREALALPLDAELISVDRTLIRAIKDML